MMVMTFCGNVVVELLKLPVNAILVGFLKIGDFCEITLALGKYYVLGGCHSIDSSTFMIYQY